MSTYLQMLCRYFKPSKTLAPVPTESSGGELAVFDLLNNRPLEGSLESSSMGVKHASPSRLMLSMQWIGQLTCLLTLGLSPLSAQTLNAVQLASLGKVQETNASNKPMEPQLLLQNEARHWLAKQVAMNVDQVQIADMDSRLKVQSCSSGTVFDHPFANRQVIRARCESPAWQYFLKASFADDQAALRAGKVSPVFASNKSIGIGEASTKAQALVSTGVSASQSQSMSKIKTVLVANQPLRRGTVLQASFFKQVELPINSTDTMVLSQFKEIENTELLHDMGAEQAIRNYDIKPTLLVKRGQQVNFSVGEGRGFLITIKTEAQQDGSLGDQITLTNVESGRFISGVITGLNEARAL